MSLKRCRLTEKQQDKLLEFLVGEMTVRTAADLAGESDFGGVRKGKRGRGGRVYTKMIPMPGPRP